MSSRKIIIDTDPGVDDGMAIQLAFNSPEFEILGLTTVFGNVAVELATVNALRLIHIANKNIPVCLGAGHPLTGTFSGGAAIVHGDDGQGNTFRSKSPLAPLNTPAHKFLIEQVTKFPKEVTIIAIGPLTNLALALQLEPGIDELVKEVIVMGGNAFCPGNVTPAAEANIFSDPQAADHVFAANWSVTMVGLDVTHKVFMHNQILDLIAEQKKPLNSYVTSTLPFYRDFFKRVNKIDGIFVHDATAVAYCLNPSLFTTIKCPVKVETASCVSKGKTWPSFGDTDDEDHDVLLPWKNRPDITICTNVDSQSVIDLLVERLTIA